MKTYRKRKEQELVNAITSIMLLSLSLAVINPKTRTSSKSAAVLDGKLKSTRPIGGKGAGNVHVGFSRSP